MILDEEVFKMAREKWGDQCQIDVAIEELGELISALIQHRRGRKNDVGVAEELADVHICLEQLIPMFGKDNFRFQRSRKMLRLFDRINDRASLP